MLGHQIDPRSVIMDFVMAETSAPKPSTEQDPRWRRVLRRDPSADGEFVYSVRTTGVYCRPSCPSREAKPANVSFHVSSAEAEAAGYRPCRRCHPNSPSQGERSAAAVVQACRLIEAAEELPKLGELAAAVGISPFHFHRRFKAATGLTPKQYGAAHRTRRVRERLSRADSAVTEAIYGAGYGSNSRFYETSNQALGMTPSNYKNGGKDAEIRFAVGECSLGAILVAVSDKGVCAILLGDDPELLARQLQDRFPRANLVGGDAGFEEIVARVVGFVEAPRIGLDLPLDIRGTAFQQRVWNALRSIPAGRTVSYGEVARSIGEPRAARAVAQACGANSLAVAIPCHRVVRRDGGPAGYRWGVERQRALLAAEVGAA
jgi:AraC family transcriptional regulator, regulatory protein of adaptative response / methylated-DNA-[protein]-cysteine methyltransferase